MGVWRALSMACIFTQKADVGEPSERVDSLQLAPERHAADTKEQVAAARSSRLVQAKARRSDFLPDDRHPLQGQ